VYLSVCLFDCVYVPVFKELHENVMGTYRRMKAIPPTEFFMPGSPLINIAWEEQFLRQGLSSTCIWIGTIQRDWGTESGKQKGKVAPQSEESNKLICETSSYSLTPLDSHCLFRGQGHRHVSHRLWGKMGAIRPPGRGCNKKRRWWWSKQGRGFMISVNRPQHQN